ncbi:MAG: phosphatase [Anaerolinea sp.]|nr:phosphatase [Anaerolinea sp.]
MEHNIESILNYLEVTTDIITGGQPSPGEITALGEAGYQIVINLATSTSPDAIPEEQELVQAAGMAYVHIPVEWQSPMKSDLLKFFAMFEPYRKFKTFVHCALNMRVSVFIYLFRVIVERQSATDCWQDVLKIWQPNETWLSYINTMLEEIIPPDNDQD